MSRALLESCLSPLKAAWLGVLLLAQPALAEELIHWHEDLASARQISQQYRVPLLIHFYGDQCMPCKTLDQNVFTRPEVASTMQRYFVPVRINATRDRRTAAEYGVHSWPQDVFVAPDGKTLLQGVCNQNANNYLQNLQNVALMNRDRNALLAGNPSPTAPAGSAYGRTATQSLQQTAPGRDGAPTPYTNPNNGANPYGAPTQLASTPINAAGSLPSGLPSPTWQGQTAQGQAQSGLVTAGPIPNSMGMTMAPAQAGPAPEHKLPNLPAHSGWSPDSRPAALGHSAAQQPSTPNLPLAPALPPDALAAAGKSGNPNGYTNGRSIDGREAIVANPHFAGGHPGAAQPQTNPTVNNGAAAQPAPQWSAATKPNVPSQLVSATTNLNSANSSDANGFGRRPVSSAASASELPNPSASLPQSSPALDGYCPVALFQENSQWIKGLEKFAIRHRGRVYYLSNEEAAQKFLAAPDAYTPVLSGHDPLVFVSEGRLVEGSIYEGVLKDKQYIHLFSSPQNKQYFYDNYDQMIRELETIVRQRQ